jgi:signal transduction histidine kinase/ligand-binding sensor domain-containing protein
MALSCAFTTAHARLLVLSVSVSLSAATLCAQDLPTVTYTTAHGLGNDVVTRVVQDPRGFLWVGGTSDVARFDGERFVRYGRDQGLDVGTGANQLLPGPDGQLWIATNGSGFFRLDLTATDRRRRLTQFRLGADRPSNRVNALQFAADGHVWAGTDSGVFVGMLDRGLHRIELPLPANIGQDRVMVVSLAAQGASMWVATSHAVYRCRNSGAGCRLVSPGGVRCLALAGDGRPWLVRPEGIEVLVDDNATSGRAETIGSSWDPRWAVRGSDGMLVVTGDHRLIWSDGRSERTLYVSPDGARLIDVAEDSAGNLWAATSAGLLGIRRQGVTLFSQPHLRTPDLISLSRQVRGAPYAFSEDERLDRIEGPGVSSLRLRRPPGLGRSLWSGRSARIDSTGDVWLGTAAGLLRFSSPRFSADEPQEASPNALYTRAHGLSGNHIADIFEDSRGDIWIATVPAGAETLTVWRRQTSSFERHGADFGLPPTSQLLHFAEDRHGTIWAALREGGMVRFASDRAEVFGVEHGLPPLITALATDRDGGLWIGGSDLVLRIDDTRQRSPRIVPVLTRLGASVVSLAQLPSGPLLVGTSTGLVIFDPADQTMRRLSSFDGLPSGGVDALVPDADGTILFIAGRTAGRLVPSFSAGSHSPPRCWLSAVRIGGRALPVSEAGVEHIDGLSVRSGENQIDLELLGLSPRLGEPLDYEYRLSGVSDTWTRAPERRISFVGLGSGAYTFEARVRSANGTAVSPAAVVSFRVLPPWYRSWWFLTLAAIAVAGAAVSAHRNRVAQVMRTERLRARIATDLHDDIGSSLSQIAILAEVARRRARLGEAAIADPLASIATTARDLVDAMSDIVWAVNPKTDSLGDLTRRMHRFAEETLGAANIGLTFSAPEDVQLKLGADVRRELYLILKESVNNIARHSGASAAVVNLALLRGELRLMISDNGVGFDPRRAGDGNGIPSMRKRAATFGGRLHIESTPGSGTQVTLEASVRRAPK